MVVGLRIPVQEPFPRLVQLPIRCSGDSDASIIRVHTDPVRPETRFCSDKAWCLPRGIVCERLADNKRGICHVKVAGVAAFLSLTLATPCRSLNPELTNKVKVGKAVIVKWGECRQVKWLQKISMY